MVPDKGYWFPAKRYGWGWGLPVRWQGWVVMAVFAASMLGGVRSCCFLAGAREPSSAIRLR